MKTVAPAEVTQILLDRIRAGTYELRGPMPTLDELNVEFFGIDAGPHPGRAAYAPLVDAGMVEARKGRGGGHFLVSLTSPGATHALVSIGDEFKDVLDRIKTLHERVMHVVEFEDKRTQTFFGESLHPSRIAAEGFAVEILTRFGVDETTAENTARYAGFTTADTSEYGVRIYGCTLGNERVEFHGRR